MLFNIDTGPGKSLRRNGSRTLSDAGGNRDLRERTKLRLKCVPKAIPLTPRIARAGGLYYHLARDPDGLDKVNESVLFL